MALKSLGCPPDSAERLRNLLAARVLAAPRASLDHLVGAREQLIRHVERERPGGFQVDDQLELGGLGHRQLRWLFTPENPARINAGFPISVRHAAVAHEAACSDEVTIMIDCGNGVALRQRDQSLAPAIKERILGNTNPSASPSSRPPKAEIHS